MRATLDERSDRRDGLWTGRSLASSGVRAAMEAAEKATNQRSSNGQAMQFAGLVRLALAIIASALIAALHKG